MKKILLLLIVLCLMSTCYCNASNSNKYVVTASCLNVRTEPNTNSKVVGGLYRGSVITGSEAPNGWTSITYNNRLCYVFSKYLKLYSSSQSTTTSYSSSDLDILSRVVNAEAGSSWLSDEHQRAVASVVLNRVADSRFPNTIKGVVYQKGQYACTWNGAINKTPSQRAINNAKYVLENGITIPSNVVFQAQFKQGNGVWKYIQGHYFCY
ncbi:MAG: cell wall hydrolase [Ruminococcaceae bacterium]|nr:cell wall hydrolase [Oscillospiraceae bacterium]